MYMPKFICSLDRIPARALLAATSIVLLINTARAGDPPQPAPLNYGPDFYKKEQIDPASLAVAANHFIGLGEDQAVKELLSQANELEKQSDHTSEHYHLLWICRVIFEGRGAPISSPKLGGLDSLPEDEMTARDWPQIPLVESQGVYFLLSDGYSLGGRPESLSGYLHRCQAEGKFRTTPVKVPTRAEAAAALTALTQESRWKHLTGRKSKTNINSCLPDLQKQVAAVPE